MKCLCIVKVGDALWRLLIHPEQKWIRDYRKSLFVVGEGRSIEDKVIIIFRS